MLLVLALAMNACDDYYSVTVNGDPGITPTVLITPEESITLPAKEAAGEIEIISNMDNSTISFHVPSDAERWCSVTLEGNRISLALEDNPRMIARSTILTIKVFSVTRKIEVVQEAKAAEPIYPIEKVYKFKIPSVENFDISKIYKVMDDKLKVAEICLEYLKNDHIACDYDSVLAILKSKNIHSCVIKSTETSHGDGVIVVNDIEYTDKDCILHLFDGRKVCLKDRLKEYEPLIFESKIYQTKQFDSFNSSSVNTIRFMTTLYPTGDVKIIAIWMKFGRAGVCVDNAGAGGNVDAGVDIKTGRIFNVTLFDEWRETRSITHHPDSGTLLEGVFIENWKQITDEIIQFQKSIPYLKAIGWDIAITPEGPLVVEFNDYWDRTGQLFLGYGWKKEIQDCYKQWKKLEDVGKVSYKMGRL